MMRTGWFHFHHDADIGVRGVGASLAEAFEQAALALTAVIADPRDIEPTRRVRMQVRAPDVEYLLYQWLNEIVYRMSVDGLLFVRYRVRIDADILRAEAWGESVNRLTHQPAVEVKGATFTALAVEPLDDGFWSAQCVVDV